MLNLKNVYVLVFTSLAGWALFAYITTTQIIKNQQNYAHIINVSGKQRVLSQKIALIANRYYETRNEKDKERLISLHENMKADHVHILTMHVKSELTTSIYYEKPKQLNEKVKYFLDVVSSFIQDDDLSLLYKIESLSMSLFPILNDAVNGFENDSEIKTKKLLDRMLFILVGTLITLILEAVFIVAPSIKHARRKEDELNNLVKERTVELEKLSVTDQLTKLYNRRKTDETLSNEIERVKRSNNSFSIILLDIDKFKNVNDTYGHQVGDDVLKSIAKLLMLNVRKVDILGRWGGEEFLIIDAESNPKNVLEFAEKIRKAIEDHVFEKVGQVTCSFGITYYVDGDTESSILARSDKALYIAKDSGRNCVKEVLA